MAAGLAEGWWYFDDDLRQHSPLIEADHWIRALEDEGYEHVTACPDADRRAGSDYAMIVGQKPGVATPENLQVHAVQQRIQRVRVLEALGARVSVVPADRSAAECARALAGGRFDTALHVVGAPGPEPDPATAIAELSGLHALCRRLLVIRDLRRGPQVSAAAELVASYAAARATEDRGQVWSYVEWDEPGVDPEAVEHVRGTSGLAAFGRVLQLADQPIVRVAPIYAEPASGVDHARAPSAEASAAGPTSAFNQRPHMETPFVAPSNELETTIAKIWEEQLGIDRVGIRDGLFELGGDSLLAGRIVAKLRDAIGVNLSMRKFLENPTVTGVAAEIESLQRTAGTDGDRGITRSARRSRGAKVQK
jgi:acyl carrier protein